MRFLLVSANQERSPDPVAPLGLCYVATAAADAGHAVTVLDLCFSTDIDADIRAAIATADPEAIGISLRNVDNCARQLSAPRAKRRPPLIRPPSASDRR